MATSQRLKTKKISSTQSEPYELESPKSPRKRPKIFSATNNQSLQSTYQKYVNYAANNPKGLQFTCSYFPATIDLSTKFGVPLGYTFSPLIALQNQGNDVMNKCVDKIPRCGQCRVYMNCYNQIIGQQKKFVCFFCGAKNYLAGYDWQAQGNNQLQYPIYQALGSPNYYQSIPGQQSLIFIFDLSREASTCQLLYYTAAAIKQCFSNPNLHQTTAYFFGYDKMLYHFSFGEEQVRCTIIDKNITQFGQIQKILIKDLIQDGMIDALLDAVQDIAKDSLENGGDFSYCFDFVFRMTRSVGGKYFIFQASESLINEPLVTSNINAKQPNLNPPKSQFQTTNKTFIQKHGDNIFNNGNSISLFIFAKNYKNIRAFGDCFKLVNCQLKYYSKQNQQELQKFYYQLTYLLNATYIKDARTQFLINRGWAHLAIYGNSHRIKDQTITFSCTQIQPTRKFFVLVTPSRKDDTQAHFCAVQNIINYRYKQQHFVTISTSIQPVTSSLPTLYSSINHLLSMSLMSKTLLSNMRVQTSQTSRRKLILAATQIYKNALAFYKKLDKIPDQIIYILSGVLAMIKSYHTQPQAILGSPLFDRIVAERNFLQFCSGAQVGAYFLPYLFDLSNLNQQQYNPDEFTYPPTIQAKFQNIKQGLFLMDNGLNLYLYIPKSCSKYQLNSIFQHLPTKTNPLSQSNIRQDTVLAKYFRSILDNLRQQKSYGWIPLQIVVAGQNSQNQRNFLNLFFNQRYDGFPNYKGSLQDFLDLLGNSKDAVGY